MRIPSIYREHQVPESELHSLDGRWRSVPEVIEHSLKKETLSVVPAFETNYMSTALGMVTAGLGIAILPESASSLFSSNGISCIQISKPVLSRRIELIKKIDRCLAPAPAAMVKILTRIATPTR